MTGWTWEAMAFNVDSGNNDEYVGNLLPDTLGTFCYTTRYSGDGGATWFYAVNGPDEGNATCPGPFGVLTVVAGADTTAPAAANQPGGCGHDQQQHYAGLGRPSQQRRRPVWL